jgi:RND family efflux transporter MFP subunit
MKRALIFIFILALIAGATYGLLQIVPEKGQQKSSRVRVDIAKLRDLESTVPATGEVLPMQSSIVKSEISGRITEIKIEEGESVSRGQVLLELDRTSLETRLREAERNLEVEQLKVDKSERNYSRLKELYSKKYVGEQEFLDAKTDLDLARLNLEIAQTRLDDAAEDLSKTTLLSPHDGVVTLLDVVEGQVISGATSVSNGTELMTVAQLKELYMEANINEVDVEQLHLGQPAYLRFDAIPNFQVEGAISVIAPSARKDGNVRVFPIEVTFAVEDARVRPGISATVEIPIAKAENVVSVLLSAVFNDEGRSSVYVETATGGWERREVTVGINNLQYVEIRSGLNEGERVSLTRPHEFQESDA